MSPPTGARHRVGTCLAAAAAGISVLAVARLLADVAWPRAVVAALVVATGVALALLVPARELPSPEPPPEEPQSSAYHPATLLATALLHASTDGWSARRIRPRLQHLAISLLALRRTTPDDAVREGSLSPGTLAWLGLGPDEAAGVRTDAPTMRRCIDEVVALTPSDATGYQPWAQRYTGARPAPARSTQQGTTQQRSTQQRTKQEDR